MPHWINNQILGGAGASLRAQLGMSAIRKKLGETDWLMWGLIIFLVGFLAAWSTRFHRDVLYFLVLAPFLLGATKGYWKEIWSVPSVKFLLIFFGYLLLSMAWSEDVEQGVLYDNIRYILMTLGFILAVAWVSAVHNEWLGKVLIVLAPVSLFVLIFSFFTYYGENDFPYSRLNNMVFYRDNPIAGSVGFVFVALLSLAAILQHKNSVWRALGWLGFLSALVFLLLAQSRGLLLGVIVGGVILLVCNKYWRVLGLVFVSCAAVIALVELTDGSRGFIERADSGRFAIWAATYERIAERPYFGEGLGTDYAIERADGRTNISPHNVFLMTALIGGSVGLLLFFCLLASTVFLANDRPRTSDSPAVLGLALLGGGLAMLSLNSHALVDTVNSHLWLGLWLPIGILLGQGLKRFE